MNGFKVVDSGWEFKCLVLCRNVSLPSSIVITDLEWVLLWEMQKNLSATVCCGAVTACRGVYCAWCAKNV